MRTQQSTELQFHVTNSYEFSRSRNVTGNQSLVIRPGLYIRDLNYNEQRREPTEKNIL